MIVRQLSFNPIFAMFYQQVISLPAGKFNHPPPPFLSLARFWGVPPAINFLLFFSSSLPTSYVLQVKIECNNCYTLGDFEGMIFFLCRVSVWLVYGCDAVYM